MKIWYYPLFVATLLLSEVTSVPSDYEYDVRDFSPIKKVIGRILGGAQKVIRKLKDGFTGEEGTLRCRPFSRHSMMLTHEKAMKVNLLIADHDYDYYGDDPRSDLHKRDVSDVDGSKKDTSVDSTDTGGDSTETADSDQLDLDSACRINCLKVSTLGGFIVDGTCYCIYL
ncbi:unnamed protein product [Callosobruchus maculatus]|uniref:Uncharacterized protein n=1 Tax=Callosobruchus maculatus TaxID=64391 RepID=A0A653DRC2_CALMS|nr:unnamed protein product [Callosobruchus maculatus]